MARGRLLKMRAYRISGNKREKTGCHTLLLLFQNCDIAREAYFITSSRKIKFTPRRTSNLFMKKTHVILNNSIQIKNEKCCLKLTDLTVVLWPSHVFQQMTDIYIHLQQVYS